MSNILKLCAWYKAQCVDEWEEEFGIKILTLDNPGWSLKIDLQKTKLIDKAFAEQKKETSETDWFIARRNGSVFEAFGGAMNLDEMIGVFLSWVG